MNRSAPLLCFFVLTGGAALGVGTPIDQGPLMAKLHATAAVVKRSGLERPADGGRQEFWQEALAIRGRIPAPTWILCAGHSVSTAHEWMLTCVCRGRAQAESLTRGRSCCASQAEIPGHCRLLGRHCACLCVCVDEVDLPACVRLVDETASGWHQRR